MLFGLVRKQMSFGLDITAPTVVVDHNPLSATGTVLTSAAEMNLRR